EPSAFCMIARIEVAPESWKALALRTPWITSNVDRFFAIMGELERFFYGKSGSTARLKWSRLLFHRLLHCHAQIGGAVGDGDAGGAEGGDFLFGRAAAAADDGAGMAHALARRRGLSGDEGRHGFGDMLLNELGRAFFRRAADFTHHQDRFRLWIGLEHPQQVDETGADNRVAA